MKKENQYMVRIGLVISPMKQTGKLRKEISQEGEVFLSESRVRYLVQELEEMLSDLQTRERERKKK